MDSKRKTAVCVHATSVMLCDWPSSGNPIRWVAKDCLLSWVMTCVHMQRLPPTVYSHTLTLDMHRSVQILTPLPHTHVHEHKARWMSDAQQSLSAKSGKRARVRGVCLMCVSCSLRSFCPWETAGASWCNQNLYIVSLSSIWQRRTGSLCSVSMNNVQMLSSNKKALAAYSLICRFIQGVSGVQGPLLCKEECQQ